MRVTWTSTSRGQVGFQAEPQEYDAIPPVDSLLLSHPPLSTNPERMAIAAYLAFGYWTSGDLVLPQRLGPNTATAIERDLTHVQVRPGPVEYYPKPLDSGMHDVQVTFDAIGSASRIPAISVLNSSAWAGSIRGIHQLHVSSNAFAPDGFCAGSFQSIRARLAVAVIYSVDLSADRLIIHDGLDTPEDERMRLRALLLSTRLGLTFVDEAEFMF